MKLKNAMIFTAIFSLGAVVGVAAKKGADASIFKGKDKKDAAGSLLNLAKTQAGKGSWELIGVGRVYYLGGMKKEGQAIFDSIKKPEGGDLIRIGRVYYAAGEWEKAKATFERALELEPKDAPWLAEVGAYYNLKGDRAKAEEYFERSLKIEQDIWNSADMAGSYIGVTPLR